MAAAWRLGQWDVLEGSSPTGLAQLGLLDSEGRWEVRLANMLAAVHTRSGDNHHTLLVSPVVLLTCCHLTRCCLLWRLLADVLLLVVPVVI